MRYIPAGLLGGSLFLNSTPAWACPYCRLFTNNGVYNQEFSANLLVLLLPLAVLLAIGIGLYYSDGFTAKRSQLKGEKS